MPDNGSGVYTVPSGSAATANTTIESSVYNALLDDLASALSSRINADGQKPYAANQPMASHKFTGLAAGSAAGDSVRYEQSPDGIFTTRGDLLRRGASAAERVALGTTGQAFVSDGTDAVWGQAGTAGIADGAVTLAKQNNLAANKLIGRATASTGVPEAVGLGTGLSMSGGNLTVATSSTSAAGLVEKATQAETNSGTADKYPSSAETKAAIYSCKAWALIASNSTPTILGSQNITSATYSSPLTTFTFTTAMANANYSVSVSGETPVTSLAFVIGVKNRTVNGFDIYVTNNGGGYGSMNNISIQVFSS